MVAQNGEFTFFGLQFGKGIFPWYHLFGLIVHQIARKQNNIALLLIYKIDGIFYFLPVIETTTMHIGNLRNLKSVESRR